MYFTADRVEKISLDTIIIINGEVTACDEETPKWSFRAKRARITQQLRPLDRGARAHGLADFSR